MNRQLVHPQRKVRKRYKELLDKFRKDPEFIELLEEVVIDKANEEMIYYLTNCEYPQPIKELDKLKNDIYTMNEWVKKKSSE